jgi:hypothetical protein
LGVLATFADHAEFDGVVLGHLRWPYHLELTRRHTDPVAPRPTEEDLLVFYLPELSEWNAVVERIRDFGAHPVRPSNPFWEHHGITFEDPDGYRIVLQNASWP